MERSAASAVTMLFSDIEGSTQLLLRLGDRYADALDLHRVILRSAWTQHGGREMGTEGDSFFVVFGSAADAVRAALQAQRGLARQVWPDGGVVTVRMGLHSGRPMPHGDGYVGIDVHRAARVSAAAHGGQIVISDATRQEVAGDFPGDVRTHDLGWHRLRDFSTPIRLYQVGWAGAREKFPPLKTLGATSSLPPELTSLVGRSDDLDRLSELLADDRARLLTLTGVAGAGKTTLAIALARSQTHAFADGVFFVPLASVRTSDDIFSELTDTLGTRSTTPSRESFLDYISGRQVLIVLDNLEQIPDAAKVLADLLAAGREVSLIATSRRALHVEGEHEFPVEPLALPESDADAAEASPAVRLFCERAAMVKGGFELTTSNASDVVDICRRLDGLPLALELAAAQLKVLSPASLLARMQSPMGLRSSTVGRPARQQTLHDAIAWSYELLTTTQQQVFRRLGVFADGFALDAVDSVAISVAGTDSLDVVVDLVDASLVAVSEDRLGKPRFRLLQTVRSFALEELEHSDDAEETRWRHAEHCRRLAQRLETVRATDQTTEARQQLRLEVENVREVLTWALRPDSATPPSREQARLGLRISALMANLWFVDNLMSEGRRWLDLALELDAAEQPTWERATALRWLAEFHGWKVADVRPALEESLAIARQLGDQGLECDALTAVGRLAMSNGDFDSARELLDQAAALARSLNDRGRIGWSCWFRGWLESDAGQHEAALVLLEDAREQARERGDELGFFMAETWCADCLAFLGRIDEAKARLQQIVRDGPEIDNPLWSLNALYIGAHICARLEDDERAAQLFGAHLGQEAAGGSQIDPAAEAQTLQESGLASVRARLGESRWEHALATGRKYTVNEAFKEILRATDSRSRSGERARRDSNPQPSDP